MMSKEEEFTLFTLAIAKLETERLNKSIKPYEVKAYLKDDFHFNVDEKNASTKVYNVLKILWSEGMLELFIKNKTS